MFSHPCHFSECFNFLLWFRDTRRSRRKARPSSRYRWTNNLVPYVISDDYSRTFSYMYTKSCTPECKSVVQVPNSKVLLGEVSTPGISTLVSTSDHAEARGISLTFKRKMGNVHANNNMWCLVYTAMNERKMPFSDVGHMLVCNLVNRIFHWLIHVSG